MKLRFPLRESLGGHAVSFEGLSMNFGELHLFRDLSLELEPGKTLGIVGPNGAGKTTLLRILLGELKAADGGVRWGSRVHKGVLQQHDLFPDEETTPFNYLRACARKKSDQELRNILGAMLFRGEEADKSVGVLSGGEGKRLMLTRLLLEGNNILLLDEPTNHLDLASREAVESALSGFEGSVLVVSHDRYFLDRLCDHVLWIQGGEWKLTHGGFREAQAARRLQESVKTETKKKPKERAKAVRVKKSPLQRMKTPELEAKIIEMEEELFSLQSRLSDPEVYRDPEKTREVKEEIGEVEDRLAAFNSEYEGRVD
jgi:ATP-binding cassette subfamily F protein 3